MTFPESSDSEHMQAQLFRRKNTVTTEKEILFLNIPFQTTGYLIVHVPQTEVSAGLPISPMFHVIPKRYLSTIRSYHAITKGTACCYF